MFRFSKFSINISIFKLNHPSKKCFYSGCSEVYLELMYLVDVD